MFPLAGTPVRNSDGMLIGFEDGKGKVTRSRTDIISSYRGTEIWQDAERRMDEAEAVAPPERRASGGRAARPEELLRAGRAREPERFGRTAEIEHTFTRAWIVSNSSAGGIRIGALEGVLRNLGISDKFRIEHDGTLTPVGVGLGADMVSDTASGAVTVTFKWRA